MTMQFTDGEAIQALHTNELIDRWMFSVRNGCAVTVNSGTLGNADTLSVASGSVFFDGNKVSVSSQNVQIQSANNEPRKDVVYIDSSGNAQVVTDAAEPRNPTNVSRFNTFRPAPDALESTGAVVVAEVWIPDNATTLGSSDISDRRLLADVAIEIIHGVDHFEDQDVKSTAPSGPTAGDWYIDDGSNTASGDIGFRVYDGTSWFDIGSGGSGGSLETQDDGVTVSSDTSVLDFGGSDFDLTNPNTGEAVVSLTNTSLTVTAGDGLKNGGAVSLGGTTTLDIEPADFAGSFLSDDGSDNLQVNLGEGLEGDGSDNIKAAEPFVYSPGMTSWETGLSNEEVARITLQTGETLEVERIEFRQKGGGSSASASIDVRDTTAATTVGTQTLGGTTKDPGSSGSGNTVIVRLNNSTGGSVNAEPRVIGHITGA